VVPLQRQRLALRWCEQDWSKLLFLAVELQACEQLPRFSLMLRWIGDREDEPDRAHSVISTNQQTPETAAEVGLDARDGVQTLRVPPIYWSRRLTPCGDGSSPLYIMRQGCMSSFVW
jgi:hypothetical protein